MTRKKTPAARLPRRVLLGRLIVEEDPNLLQSQISGLPLMIGLHPNGERYAVFGVMATKTIHVLSEVRPVRSVSLSALAEAIVTAKAIPKRKAPQ